MHSIHIRVPEELYEAMREEAYGCRRSLNSITVDALYEAWHRGFVPDDSARVELRIVEEA